MSFAIWSGSIAANIAALNPCTGPSFLCSGGCLAEALLEVPLDFASQIAVLDLAPAIPALLARRKGELDLRPRTLEVDACRDEGQAPLGRLSDQPLDLASVEKQLPRAVGIVVLVRSRQVRRDVGAPQPDLPFVDHGICLVQLRLALAEGLDLAATELDSRLHLLQQLKAVTGPAVGGDIAAHGRPRSLRLLGHHGSTTGRRSTRPRGAPTRSTATVIGSPRRIASPPRPPRSMVSVASSS